MRDLRSDMVYKLQKQARLIFGILDLRFCDKKSRQDIPEVQALLKDNAFLYDPPGNVKGLMRHPCILKVSYFPYLCGTCNL